MSKHLNFVVAALACLSPLFLCPSGAHAQDSTIRSETRLVLVDAVVTDKKGNPVKDLAQKDFKVFEDNKEQTITSFTSEAASPDPDRKHYLVLFFDNTAAGPSQTAARRAALKFVESNAAPGHMMAVAEFVGSLRLTQNFTNDPDLVKVAVGGAKFIGTQAVVVPGIAAGTQNNFAVRNLLGSLRSLARSMAALPGRKNIIFISAGFTGSQEVIEEITATVQECNRDNVALYPVASSLGETSQDLFGSDSGANTVGSGRRAPARNTQIADTAGSGGGMEQSLYNLAGGTGGYVIGNTNDIVAGMEKVGIEQGETYILGYTPSKDAAPGACHSLKVKTDRSGVTIRARSGYCEAVTQDVLAGTPVERDLETRMNSNAPSTVAGATLLTPFFYTAKNTARVHVLLDVPPGSIAFTKDKAKFRATLNVVGVATQPDGAVKARFSDSVKIAFDDKKEVDAFLARPFQYEKQFPIGPGKYSFQVVFSSAAKQFGRLETPLSIDAWEPATFFLSGLALSKSVHPAKPKVEGIDPGLVDDKVSLTAGGFEIMPIGSNHLKKSEKEYLYAEIYEPAMAVPNATAKDVPAVGVRMELLDSSDKVKKDFGLMRIQAPPITGNPAVPMGLIVEAPELDPGPYKLRLTAMDDKGHQSVRTMDIQLDQ